MRTADEIIKVFEGCNKADGGMSCLDCPFRKYSPACIEKRNEAARDIIKRLQAENKQLQSDVITANQNLEYFKELWEADKAKAKEAISKYIDKHNELILHEKEIQHEGAKAFTKFLIDEAENSVIPIDAIPNLVREWVGDKE